MAGFPELARPGVEVIQQFQAASPTIVRPTLVPFVTGPAKEIVEVTTADGLLNADAKQGSYDQLPKTVSQTAFPSPRGNINEVDVEEKTIKAFFLVGGALKQLERDPGESFLVAWNKSTKAAIRTKPITGAGLALDGLTMVIAINVTARLNTTKDVVVTFAAATPGGNLTAAEVQEQINDAVGEDVATLIVDGADNRVQIASLVYGARSSVTLRAGGSANTLLFGASFVNDDHRVEGAGFRGQDLQNNTTVTPWVEWTRGGYLVGATATAFPAITGSTPGFGLIDQDGVFNNSQASALTFTGGGSIDVKKGDQFFADGVAPNGAFVSKVESTRFKLGTLNTTLSTFDEDGKVVNAVYTDSSVNTLFAAVPFSPRYAYFKARNLSVNTTATAAELTGTTEGNPAETAVVEGTTAPAGPFNLTGLTLVIEVTVDGVVGEEQTFTFTGGPLADMTAVAAAVAAGIDDATAANNGGKLKLTTLKTGALQELRLKSTSTALAALGFPTGSDIVGTGKDVEFVNTPASLITVADITFPLTLGGAGETLIIEKSTDGTTFPTPVTHTFSTPGPFANMAALLSELTSGTSWGGAGPTAAGLAISASGNKLVIKSLTGGHLIGLRVGAASTSIGNTASDIRYTSLQNDFGEDEITATQFKFKLNDRPKVYTAVFTSNSLIDAVDTINAAVGFVVASAGGSNERQLTLTSTLKGQASKVETVVDSASLEAHRAFGFGSTAQSATGTGRPNPDFYLDVSGSVVLGAEILRNPVTGSPFNPGAADTYIQYTGLRKDVSPAAANAALLQISDTTTLGTVLNPINADNPLGLAMFFQLLNAPGTVCTGLGVDEISAAEPFGTPLAYSRVLGFVEPLEVYAMAPLTHNETVHQAFITHAVKMSEPANKGERIVFFNPTVPTRAVDKVIGSGLNGSTTATENEFVLDSNPSSALLDAGINPALPIDYDDQLYLQLEVDGIIRNYSVSAVNGVVVTLRVAFDTGENTDDYFTETPLTETLVNADWTLSVRGAKLLIPGSTLPDKEKIAETVATRSAAFKQRRAYLVFPDKVTAALGGTDQLLPAFYACAAITGMVAAQPPQQGFTNLPMTGFNGVQGSQDTFTNRQLNIMAAGGTYILVQDADGAPIICRHQLSTNTTTIEARELSITKVVDFTAKFLRTGLRNFIGTFNITQPFLDMLSSVIHGMTQFLVESGVLVGAELNNVIQSKEQPDTVLVDITLDVPYPCNYIRLTLII